MKMRTTSSVITYYNLYFYGSQEYYNVKQTYFSKYLRNKFGKLETNTPQILIKPVQFIY